MSNLKLSIFGNTITDLDCEGNIAESVYSAIKKSLSEAVVRAIKYGVVDFYTNYKTNFDTIVMDVLFELKDNYPFINIGVVTDDTIVIWNDKMYNCSKYIMKKNNFPPLCVMCYKRSVEKMVNLSNFCIVFWDGKDNLIKNTISYAENNKCKVKVITV